LQKTPPGFSLLEIVVVMLILAILAAVAGPRYAAAMQRYQLEAAAKRLSGDLEHARRYAKMQGKPQLVVFTPANHQYTFPGLQDIHRAAADYLVQLQHTEYPAEIVSVTFGSANNKSTQVTFDMYGRPDAGGSVVIAVGGDQRTIQVDAATGMISVLP
jgi:type II secretion system protein H